MNPELAEMERRTAIYESAVERHAHGGHIPHPWSAATGLARLDAAGAAAHWCRTRGYPPKHAAMAVLDWDRHNRPPLGRKTILNVLASAYQGSQTERSNEPALVPLSAGSVATPREWLVPGILPAGQRVGISGGWSLGKSWLALDLALSVARGSSFLGCRPPTLSGNVVLLDGEGGHRRAVSRFGQLLAARGLTETDDADPPGGVSTPNSPQTQSGSPVAQAFKPSMLAPWTNVGLTQTAVANSPMSQHRFEVYRREASDLGLGRLPGGLGGGRETDRLVRQLSALEPRLVIFDTLAKVMGLPDENSNAAAARVTSALYRLGERLGATILVLSHPAKADARVDSIRGAGEFTADLDVLWTVREKPQGLRSAVCVKDRDGDIEGTSFDYRISRRANAVGPEDPSTKRVDVRNVICDILERAGGSVGSKPLRKDVQSTTGVARTTLYRYLNSMEASGRIVCSNGVYTLVAGGRGEVSQ